MKCFRLIIALVASTVWLLPLLASAECIPEVVIKTPDGSKTQIVAQGEAIRTGQKIRIESRSPNGCYLLVFWKDSSHQVHNLTSKLAERRVGFYLDRNSTYPLPSKESWFTLDDVLGIEQIVVVSSAVEIASADKIGIGLAMEKKPEVPGWLLSNQTLQVLSRILHHED